MKEALSIEYVMPMMKELSSEEATLSVPNSISSGHMFFYQSLWSENACLWTQISSDLHRPTGRGVVIHKMKFGLYVSGMETIISLENDNSAFQLETDCPWLKKTYRISYQISSKAVKGRLGKASQFPLFLY